MNLLKQIEHFQQHVALPGKRRPIPPEQRPARLEHIAERHRQASQALSHPQPGWLNFHGSGWERFFTRQRCLLLEYGRYQPGEGGLLEIRIAPDGTALLRVARVDAKEAFSQRVYLSPSGPRARSTRSPGGPPGPPGFLGGAQLRSLHPRS